MTDDPQAEALEALRRQVAALEQQLAEAETSRAAAHAADLAVQARIALEQRLVDEALMLTLAAARAVTSLPQPPLAVTQIVRRVLEQIPPQRSRATWTDNGASIAWSRDSRLLAVASTNRFSETSDQVDLWDVATGTIRTCLWRDRTDESEDDDQNVPAPQFAMGTIPSDLRGIEPCHYLYGIGVVGWSPDGRTLLLDRFDGAALLWDTAGDAPHLGLPGPKAVLVPPFCDAAEEAPDDEPETFALEADGEPATSAAAEDAPSLSFLPPLEWANHLFDSLEAQALPNAATERPLHVRSIGWSVDGARLLIAYDNSRSAWWHIIIAARLWDVATGALLAELTFDQPGMSCAAASPDARSLAVGTKDGVIQIWDVAAGALRLQLSGSTDEISSLTWSPDGTRLLSGGPPVMPGRRIEPPSCSQIWDSDTGALIATIDGFAPYAPWSPDGLRVLTIVAGALLNIWDAATGAHVQQLVFPPLAWLISATWSPDGLSVVVPYKGGLAVWDLTDPDGPCQLDVSPNLLHEYGWSPDRRWVAVIDDCSAVRVYDLARWRPNRPLPTHRLPLLRFIPPEHSLDVSWTAAGPRAIASYSLWQPRHLQAFDLDGPLGPPLKLSNAPAALVLDTRWHPQGRTALLGVATQETLEQSRHHWVQSGRYQEQLRYYRAHWFGRLLHWEVATGAIREIHSDGPLVDVQWSPDGGRYALLAVDGGVQIRAAATDALLDQVPAEGHGVFLILWSPDGSALLRLQFVESRAQADDGEQHLRVLATVHGAQMLRGELRFEHQWRFHGAGWGPDGPQLLVEHPVPNVSEVWQENIHRGLTMWDLGQGTVQWQTNNPILSSSQATWSPDGRRILLHSGFRQAVIDAATGAVLEIFESNVVGGMAWDLEGTPTERWRPDGREFFSFPFGAEWEPTRRCRFIVARDLLEAELTRRVCERLGDSMGEANADAHLCTLIPDWRGANAELAALAALLAEYDALCTWDDGPNVKGADDD